MRNLRNTDVDVPYRTSTTIKTQNFYPLSVYRRPDDKHSIYWTLLKKNTFVVCFMTRIKSQYKIRNETYESRILTTLVFFGFPLFYVVDTRSKKLQLSVNNENTTHKK